VYAGGGGEESSGLPRRPPEVILATFHNPMGCPTGAISPLIHEAGGGLRRLQTDWIDVL
jgi:hypothetical protein